MKSEGPPIPRRKFLVLGIASFVAGSSIAALTKNLSASSEPVNSQAVSEVINRYGTFVVHTFLRNGIIKNKNITQITHSLSSDVPPIPVLYFRNTLSFTKPRSHPHVLDFHPTEYALSFKLYKDDYDTIIADPRIPADQKNHHISQNLIALGTSIAVDAGNNSYSAVFNEMEKDETGNWTDRSTHAFSTKTTNPKAVRFSKRFASMNTNDLQIFGSDMTKILRVFRSNLA